MDMYFTKKYFEEICSTHCVAYEKLTRLKESAKNMTFDEIAGNIMETTFWMENLEACEKEAAKVLRTIQENHGKLLVTSKEEVRVLISIYAKVFLHRAKLGMYVDVEGKEYSAGNILITDEGYPEDELSKEFLKAYETSDESKMYSLWVDNYGKAIY